MKKSLISELKVILKHSTTYSIANLLSRMVSFIMIPIYTRFLTPADYGILELITISLSMLSIVISSGITDAVSRFYFDYKNIKDKNKVISVGLISFIVLAAVSFAILSPINGFLSKVLLGSSEYGSFLVIALGYMSLSFILELIFAYFRVTHQSLKLTLSNLGGLVVSLSFNILFVVVLQIGVRGILLATLISQSLQVIVLLPMTIKAVGFRFDFSLFKKMLSFGFPIIFSQIGHKIVNLSDRYFLRSFATLADTGLYSLGYKLGLLATTFVGAPFNMIWTPRRFECFGDEEAENNFSRIFTLFIFVISLVGLIISILAKDLTRLFLTEEFWTSYKVVPIITLSYIFLSFHSHFSIGILIKKKTKLLAGINIATAILNLILNYFLIKTYSIWGAAVATLISFIFKPSLSYYYSNKIYPIQMETKNLIKIIGIAIVIYTIGSFVETNNTLLNMGLKGFIGLSYVLILYVMHIFTKEEIQKLKDVIKKLIAKIRFGKTKK